MFDTIDFCYFSPTGGTKKAGALFCAGLGKTVNEIDLTSREPGQLTGGLLVVAAPVYGGRIPGIAVDRLKMLRGNGAKAVTLAVYGNRDFDDALLELNDTMTACGFNVVSSAALNAQHSLVPEVGKGRPDADDAAAIADFAHRVLEKIENGSMLSVSVPGNRPYKAGMNMPVSPLSLPACSGCAKCASVCPTKAIVMSDGAPVTDAAKCILCMACAACCPEKARILPPELAQNLNEKLGALKSVRSENAYFL